MENIDYGSIWDKIIAVYPMTEEQAAGGRQIKDYPFKYDDFANLDTLAEYVRRNCNNVQHLSVQEGYTSGMNTDQVYYRPLHKLTINEEDPTTRRGCMRYENAIVNLSPKRWEKEVLDWLLDEMKRQDRK